MKKTECDECGVTKTEPGVAGGQSHQPTSKNRKFVFEMARCGVSHIEIARVINIAAGTLRLHYREVLATARTVGNTTMANSVFRAGTRGRSVHAMSLWLKCRAGWSETIKLDTVDHTAEQYDLSRLTDEQIDQWETLQLLAQVPDEDDETISEPGSGGNEPRIH